MRRRDFLGLLSAGASWPFAARATNQTLRVAWVGFVPKSSPTWAVIPRRMAELGFREGENLILDYVQIEGAEEDIYAGYRQIATRNPDILVAIGPDASVKAALASTQTTPIVALAIDFDLVAEGFASSFARPGGRVTGVNLQQLELIAKRMQFFKEAIPDFASAVVFYDKLSREQWNAVDAASVRLGVHVYGVDLRDPPYDYDRALGEAPPNDCKYLLCLASPLMYRDREQLAKFALRRKLATMSWTRQYVDAGALMSYGASFDKLSERIADKVVEIARGAKPGDLPIEQPTQFEFVINLSTARALGVELPPTLLARADELIE